MTEPEEHVADRVAKRVVGMIVGLVLGLVGGLLLALFLVGPGSGFFPAWIAVFVGGGFLGFTFPGPFLAFGGIFFSVLGEL